LIHFYKRMNLTSGALIQMCAGEDVSEPLLQVLGYKVIKGAGQEERFRLLLSDSQFTNSFAMLATQNNSLVHEKQLEMFTVIRVKKFVCNEAPGQKKRVLIILDLDVVALGQDINMKIGNPVQMGADRKTSNPKENENPNPNTGGVKRPSSTPITDVSSPKSKVVYKPPARPSIGSSGIVATPIASITPYQNRWTIKARVTSKGQMKTWNKPSGSGKLFALDLMDDSGEIRVTAFNQKADEFFEEATVGKVYYISNCSVKAANKQFCQLKNDYELTFKENGTMELVEDDTSDVPTMTYNFVKISDLTAAQIGSAVDIIGVCKSHNELISFMTRAGKELIKREIVLVDTSETEVLLTLWGDTATKFSAIGNPVVAAKGAKVSDFNGVTLSGMDILVNPDMDIAHELKGWWENEGQNSRTTSISVQGQRSNQGPGVNTKTIGEVNLEKLGSGSERGEYYSIVATVLFFSKDRALYKACIEDNNGKACNRKIMDNGDGTYRCEKCAKDNNSFKWRITMQLNIGDATDNLWATCFHETGEKLLGVPAAELGYWLETDVEKYNNVFASLTFKPFNFKMRVAEDNYKDDSKLKHTVVQVDEIEWKEHCKRLVSEIEAGGEAVPTSVDGSNYA